MEEERGKRKKGGGRRERGVERGGRVATFTSCKKGLLEKYFMQSDREKSEGRPVTPVMHGDSDKSTAQIELVS